jgi:GST-like protein
MQLYGVRGWGSTITEAMLALAGQPYEFIDVDGFDRPGAARDRLAAINPLAQVPALVLDDGLVMTETAAITLYLSEQLLGLAPGVGTAERARFYRLLIWLVANVYPTFTYGDYPERWVPSAPKELVAATDRYRERLYELLEGQVTGPFILGDRISALDIYIAVMVTWRPRIEWFELNTPKLAKVAELTRQTPPIDNVMKLNGLL